MITINLQTQNKPQLFSNILKSHSEVELFIQITDYQRHKDIYQHTILFEDVIADPEREIKKIFDLMDIGHEHVPGALESLKEDSQRGTFGPRGKRPKGCIFHL